MVATRSRTSRDVSPEVATESAVIEQPSKTSRQSSPAKSARSVSPKKRKQPEDEVKEKTVREQLKKTHVQEPADTNQTTTTSAATDSSDRGRPRRKRSFEEVGKETADDEVDADASKHKHVRKRSKSAEDGQEDDGFILVDKPTTPPPTEPSDSAIASPAAAEPKTAAKPATPPSKIPTGSGFANASVTSPFANLGAGKSVFGASAIMSPKADEPVATLGSSSLASPKTGFASPKPDDTDTTKLSAFSTSSTTSGFGSLAGKPSVFGSSSGFGKVGGGTSVFGSANGSTFGGLAAGKLSTFSSGKGTFGSAAIEANRPSKAAFGAPADGEEEEDDDGEDGDDEEAGVELGAGPDDLPQDDRFYEQDIETGEEHETTVWQDKAKLYINEDQQWKERCTGTLKVNMRNSSEESASKEDGEVKMTARFIMRSAASHKVLLNSPLTKDVMLGDPTKGPPKGRQAVFLGFVEGKPRMMLIKMRTESQIATLFDKLAEIQQDL